MVASITGIRQTETVPDSRGPGRRRGRAGRHEPAGAAPADGPRQHLPRRTRSTPPCPSYFREGNLAALRELALLWLADRVDEGLERYREAHGIDGDLGHPGAGRGRRSPAARESAALMRRAARIASRTAGGEWLAVYVSRSDGLSGVSADQLERLRRTADGPGRHVPRRGGRTTRPRACSTSPAASTPPRSWSAPAGAAGSSTLLRPGDRRDGDRRVRRHRRARGHPRLRPRPLPAAPPPDHAGPAPACVAGYLMATARHGGADRRRSTCTPDLHGLPTESLLMMALVVATALVGGLLAGRRSARSDQRARP